jgi:hypothetical protein
MGMGSGLEEEQSYLGVVLKTLVLVVVLSSVQSFDSVKAEQIELVGVTALKSLTQPGLKKPTISFKC